MQAQAHTFEFTNHGKQRAQQRGISQDDIRFILKHAKPLMKQGLKFFSLKNKGGITIPSIFKRDALMNLIVITSFDEEAVITVYKNEKAWKRIKRKRKYLQ